MIGAQLIIIDEVTMLSKHGLRVTAELLRRLMNNPHPLGGKTVVISGDFRQTLPVKRGAGATEIIELCLKKSNLWHHFTQLNLISNMRSPSQNAYNQWILDLGVGNTAVTPGLDVQAVEIPRYMVIGETDNLVDVIFTENVRNLSHEELACNFVLDKSLLP